jgi:hypothetical protein
MPRVATIAKKQQNETIASRRIQLVIKRNATSDDLDNAKQEHIGTTFTLESHDTYRVVDCWLDDLFRLLIVGELKK